MNVLMVTLAYDPAIAFGGPVKVVQNNARELVRRGHHVTVYCTNRLDHKQKMTCRTVEHQDRGVRVVYHNAWFMPQWRGNFGPFISPGMIAYLVQEGRAFDLIHINEARTFSTLVAGLYAQAMKIPYVIQAHGSFRYGLRYRRMKKLFDLSIGRRIFYGASKVIALTEGEISECQAVGIGRDKMELIRNGFDFISWKINREKRPAFRSKWGIPTDAVVVLFLGRIDKIKGPDILVEGFSKLKAQDLYCVFSGPDDDFQFVVKDLIKKHGLSDRVMFTGLLNEVEVQAAYAAADIFALPSRFDTFPMAAVEALASGLPVLITETCQIAHLINGRAGIVVRPESAEIADGLRELLDPNVRDTYARGARKLAEEEFSIEKTVDRLEEVYRQVINQGGTRLGY
ncbi:MAG: glycosyltransferase [Candidatus Omnitrophica bacterium]|nr:glycosyltransferase [Candidatus Omnitrophota bacterium]